MKITDALWLPDHPSPDQLHDPGELLILPDSERHIVIITLANLALKPDSGYSINEIYDNTIQGVAKEKVKTILEWLIPLYDVSSGDTPSKLLKVHLPEDKELAPRNLQLRITEIGAILFKASINFKQNPDTKNSVGEYIAARVKRFKPNTETNNPTK